MADRGIPGELADNIEDIQKIVLTGVRKLGDSGLMLMFSYTESKGYFGIVLYPKGIEMIKEAMEGEGE